MREQINGLANERLGPEEAGVCGDSWGLEAEPLDQGRLPQAHPSPRGQGTEGPTCQPVVVQKLARGAPDPSRRLPPDGPPPGEAGQEEGPVDPPSLGRGATASWCRLRPYF